MEVIFNKLNYSINRGSLLEKNYLNHVDMEIKNGEIVGIVGEDIGIIGELIKGFKRPSKGEIRIDEIVIKKSNHVHQISELRKKVGFVSKEEQKYLSKTVEEEINLYMVKNDYKVKMAEKHIVDSLKLVGLSKECLKRDPNSLSYTEKKKVNLAKAMSINPELLILEEFEKGLIFREREYFKKLFLKLKSKLNKTVIIISKDVSFMFSLVNNIYVIHKGHLVLSGNKDIFYEDNLYQYTKMPKIVEFTKYVKSKGHDILEYTDFKELIKELYRRI